MDKDNLLSENTENFFNPIRPHKAKHMLGVALHMSKMAELFKISKDEAYILGYLHDIGYIKGKKGHSKKGAELLEMLGINENFTNAIKYHGTKPSEVPKNYITPYLMCLWDGDCSINTTGEDIGYKGRLKDVGERYGKNSVEYETMKEQIEYLNEYLQSKERN